MSKSLLSKTEITLIFKTTEVYFKKELLVSVFLESNHSNQLTNQKTPPKSIRPALPYSVQMQG